MFTKTNWSKTNKIKHLMAISEKLYSFLYSKKITLEKPCHQLGNVFVVQYCFINKNSFTFINQ